MLAGCGEDEIRHYKAARLEQPKPAARTRAPMGEQRLLAAIIPHADRTWFCKLVGPAATINNLAEPFEQFVRSIRFEEGKEISWTLPDGWDQHPGSASRYATIHIDSDDQHLDLTVVPLGREAGSLLDNVNRWRNQLGMNPVGESDLAQLTRDLKLDGMDVTIVDMSVAGPAMPPGHHPVGPTASRSPSGPAPLKYAVPEGWKEVPSQSAFRVASFEVEADGKRADVSVSPLSGAAGGALANVNRWRDQIGLPPIDGAKLRDDVREIEVASAPANLIELVGPESAGEKRQSILGVILERGAQTWFFKMTGPADLVAKQRSAFEEFVRSVRFE
jgi:hypothetical protein